METETGLGITNGLTEIGIFAFAEMNYATPNSGTNPINISQPLAVIRLGLIRPAVIRLVPIRPDLSVVVEVITRRLDLLAVVEVVITRRLDPGIVAGTVEHEKKTNL